MKINEGILPVSLIISMIFVIPFGAIMAVTAYLPSLEIIYDFVSNLKFMVARRETTTDWNHLDRRVCVQREPECVLLVPPDGLGSCIASIVICTGHEAGTLCQDSSKANVCCPDGLCVLFVLWRSRNPPIPAYDQGYL